MFILSILSILSDLFFCFLPALYKICNVLGQGFNTPERTPIPGHGLFIHKAHLTLMIRQVILYVDQEGYQAKGVKIAFTSKQPGIR